MTTLSKTAVRNLLGAAALGAVALAFAAPASAGSQSGTALDFGAATVSGMTLPGDLSKAEDKDSGIRKPGDKESDVRKAGGTRQEF